MFGFTAQDKKVIIGDLDSVNKYFTFFIKMDFFTVKNSTDQFWCVEYFVKFPNNLNISLIV